MSDRLTSLPTPITETYIDFVTKMYFSPHELTTARRLLKQSESYAEAISYLIECGKDLRQTSIYLTIPGGRVLINRPDRPEGSLAYVPVTVKYLAHRALPDPQEKAVQEAGKNTRLGFWTESELTAQSQEEPSVPAGRSKSSRPKKPKFIEHLIVQKYGPPIQGWVVKDRGLGYFIEPMRTGEDYLVRLIHLKSRREMALIFVKSIDHERIRAWVSACVSLTDWTRGIQVILGEKEGKHKQQAWATQLESIWREQQSVVKRQLAFF